MTEENRTVPIGQKQRDALKNVVTARLEAAIDRGNYDDLLRAYNNNYDVTLEFKLDIKGNLKLL